MAEIIWTAPALSNLTEIAEYIALSNLPAAKKLTQNLYSSFITLNQLILQALIVEFYD